MEDQKPNIPENREVAEYGVGVWGGRRKRRSFGSRFVGTRVGPIRLGNVARMGLTGEDFNVSRSNKDERGDR